MKSWFVGMEEDLEAWSSVDICYHAMRARQERLAAIRAKSSVAAERHGILAGYHEAIVLLNDETLATRGDKQASALDRQRIAAALFGANMRNCFAATEGDAAESDAPLLLPHMP
jgi:hypothetical protein